MAKSSSKMLNVSHDDKLFSKLLSKDKYNSPKPAGEASFRVLYYGGAAGSVPFLWESQPGTPKHTFNDNPLPPLTPPPSYQFSPQPNLQKKNYSKNSKMFNSIFSKNPSKKIINSSPLFSPSSSSSFSSSYSLPSTPFNNSRKSDFKARSRSAVRFGLDNEDEYEVGKISPTSTLCFGPRSGSSSRRFKGYYTIKSVKKVVLSIVGHAKDN